MSGIKMIETDLGIFPSNWNNEKLGNVTKTITKGTTPTTLGRSFTSEGINFIKVECVKANGLLNKKQLSFIDLETHILLKRSQINERDILFSIAGALLGKTILVRKDYLPANTNQALAIIRANPVRIEPEYLHYLISSDFFHRYITNQISQSAQPNISLGTLEKATVVYPNHKTQKNIVLLLDSLTNSIINKADIIEKLEELSNVIFTNFFLSNKNDKKESCFGSIVSELTKKISLSDQDEFKVLSAVNTGQLIPSEDYFSKQVFSKDLSKYKTLEQFDFAYNPARVNIGSIGMLDKPIKGCVSPVYIAFRTKPNWHYFVDLMIKQPHIRKTIEVYCSGSVRQVLRFEDFCRIEIKLPPEKKVLEFNEVYKSILNKINHNKQQIEKLTALRDTILPKLMTGKIEIKN